MDFYRTIPTTEDLLKKYIDQGMKQRDVVLKVFKVVGNEFLTPFQVYRLLDERWPITSIRRAITDLTSMGELVKTHMTEDEEYGKKNYLWRLPVREPEQKSLF